jgi:hypothetical protein
VIRWRALLGEIDVGHRDALRTELRSERGVVVADDLDLGRVGPVGGGARGGGDDVGRRRGWRGRRSAVLAVPSAVPAAGAWPTSTMRRTGPLRRRGLRLEPEGVGDLLPIDLLGFCVPRDAPASRASVGSCLPVAQPVIDRLPSASNSPPRRAPPTPTASPPSRPYGVGVESNRRAMANGWEQP